MRQLGEILLDEGLVNEAQLLAAMDETAARGQSLGRVLVEEGVLSEMQLVAALASQVGMQFVDLDDYPVDRAAISVIPAALCRRHGVLPISFQDGALVVAMADPGNVMAVDDLRSVSGLQIRPVVAVHDNLARAIERFCRADDEMEDLAESFEETASADVDLSNLGQIGASSTCS